MIRKLLLSFLFFSFSFFSFGKNTTALKITTLRANYYSDKISIVAGTITSTSTGGNWSDGSSWVGGVVPGATDDVVIASSATITSAGIINAKTLTINGNLIVSNTVTLNSVTQVTINGLLSFADNNSNIHLPSGTSVKVNSPGKVDKSKCSNNVAIYIGTTKIAACAGNGGGAVYDFDAFNSGGGTISAIANSNTPVCQNGTINLTGSYSGSAGKTTSSSSTNGVNYSWSVIAPDGATTASNSQNYNLTATQTGSYTAILTCTTYYGGDVYTSTSTINVSVSQAFSLTSVTAVQCNSSSPSIVTLNATASGLPTGTYTVTYNTANPPTTAKTATMTVSTAGNGTFTTTDLITANSSTITITNLASGSSGNSCSNTISSGNTATLQTPPSLQSGYIAYQAPVCYNTSFTLNLLGNAGNVVQWEKKLSTSSTWIVISNSKTNNLTETPSSGGTWQYRVLVGDINCSTTYTSVLSVVVNPELSITFPATNIFVCRNSTTIPLPYSATTGNPVDYSLVFDAAAVSAGFDASQNGSLPSGAIVVRVPYSVAPGTYNAYVKLITYTPSCTSANFPVTVTVSSQIATVSIAPAATQNFCTTGNVLTVTESGSTITSRQWGKRSVSGGTITPISGATGNTYLPTLSDLTAGTWYVVCTSSNGGCLVTSNEVIVNAGNIARTASSTPTLCVGTAISPAITHTTINATGINSAGITGLPAGVTASWNANTITISGTPSATGTFTYNIPLTGCANAVSATGTITVNPTNTITLTSAPGTNAQSVCKDIAISNITYSTTGATGATVTGLPTGVTGSWASNTVTISGTPTTTTNGTFNYTVTLSNGCGNVTATGTIIVSVPNRGQVHGGKHICLGEDSPELYMSTYSGTILKWQYSDDPLESPTSWQDISHTLNTYQPPKLAALRTYRVVIKNGNCPEETAIQTRIDIDIRPTFTVSPSATSCPNTDVTYTTQSGQRDYIWTVPGTLGTDYSITSGGLATSDNSVTLKWLTAGSKTVTVTYSNACSNNPVASSTTTVNEFSVSAPQSSSFCVNSQITPVTHTLKGFDGIGTGSFNLPSGLTVSYDGTTKTLTISGTPAVQGTYNYSIPLTASGCTISGQATGTITVNALPATPTATLISSPTCANPTASIRITGLPSSSWTLYRNSVQVATGTGAESDYTDTGLIGGTAYAYSVASVSCTSNTSTAITPLAVPSTKYTSGGWDNGDPSSDPTNLKNIIFEGNYIATNDVYGCSCTVNSGNIIIQSGKTLTITNALIVNGGSLTFEDSSNLIQKNTSNTLNSGNIIYKRNAGKIRQADYVYWSTPVKNQTLAALSPLTSTSKLYAYDGTKWVFTPRTTVMAPAKGYIVRGPETFSNTAKSDFTGIFIGTPQNGTFSGEPMTAGQPYLLGNPYPSALDADDFITANSAIIEGALYFWTHNTPVVLGGAYEYETDDYATYTLSGGAGTYAAPSEDDPELNDPDLPSDQLPNSNVPNGQVASGQAFFVKAYAQGSATFTNSMRSTKDIHGNNTNGQFFKPGKASKTAAIEKHRVWLNMTNAGGAFKQLLVAYVEGATNSYDRLYDGKTFDGNKFIDFYSINDNHKLVVQGRGLPFTDADQVPLGYRSTIAGDFTISIDHADGDMKTQAMYIEDKKTGKIHDLKAGKYTFTTEIGTFTDRLVLRYSNKSLGTGDFENVENGVLVSIKDKTIKVLSSQENLKEVNVYDISGRLLYNKTKINSNEMQISNLQSSNQVLIVKVTLENDFSVSKKIIFQ
ncbi:T9SS sorting signal type C domain-containing protein [Flavobacterium denitrificans]|uniref:T9SS sorting signal type C domain-containing protein n=1 Tax=Flavobacterium denitrificans TaxID=281361 RepID=UPI00040DB263|nr:T9SS sorting signal type C domain-containing protein [Flavobacterium denitrificans]